MKPEDKFLGDKSLVSNSVPTLVAGSQSLPLTWERIVPNQTKNDSASQKFLDLHFGRYKTAASYVSGKKVLDIACGSGYGSRILKLAGATSVVGVDVSLQTIEYAKKNYQENDIEFICADAEQFEWPERFDIVTSFETIEHLYHPEKFLERIHNLLIPDGVFLLSVPLGETRHMDPYHLHAFSQNQVLALLKKTGFSVDWHRWDECFLTRSELLRWGKLYPESSPSMNELLFSPRGWRIISDFVLRGGFDIPQLLVSARSIN